MLLELLGRLADESQRAEIGKQLATLVGADDLIIFIIDTELGILLPATGFDQTLKRSADWQYFLKSCVKEHLAPGKIYLTEGGAATNLFGIAYKDECVLVLMGGNPNSGDIECIKSVMPLLNSVMQYDHFKIISKAQLSLADKSILQAEQMAQTLDATRRELYVSLNSLREKEERFRTLIEQSTDAIQLVSPAGEILYTSESIKNVLGYTPEELGGLGVNPFLHPDDLEYFYSKLQEVIANPLKPIMLEYRVKHKDGSWAWLETTGINHLNTPNINAIVGTFRNITESKKSQLELLYQKSLLETQQEVSPMGIVVVSKEGSMVSYNNRFAEMWDFSKEVMEARVDELALKAAQEQLVDPDGFINRVKEVYKKRSESHEKIYFNDGRIYERYGSPIIGADGSDYGYTWYFLDITERENLARQKDDFIGIASHELKTPVTSIKAYTQLLHKRFTKSGDIQSADLVSKMNTQLNKLSQLIGDLLDVTKIESGKLHFNESTFEFNELVEEIVEEIQRTTENHRIIRKLCAPHMMYGDRERIGQVIINLLTNAIKYSPNADKVVVSTSATARDIQLCVVDYGVGISSEKKDHVFERFYRVSGPAQDTFPGLGLGLYISSEIIKRKNGKIWVESEEGQGSTFCFSLPNKQPSKRAARKE